MEFCSGEVLLWWFCVAGWQVWGMEGRGAPRAEWGEHLPAQLFCPAHLAQQLALLLDLFTQFLSLCLIFSASIPLLLPTTHLVLVYPYQWSDPPIPPGPELTGPEGH